jgi:hypothetical protein
MGATGKVAAQWKLVSGRGNLNGNRVPLAPMALHSTEYSSHPTTHVVV